MAPRKKNAKNYHDHGDAEQRRQLLLDKAHSYEGYLTMWQLIYDAFYEGLWGEVPNLSVSYEHVLDAAISFHIKEGKAALKSETDENGVSKWLALESGPGAEWGHVDFITQGQHEAALTILYRNYKRARKRYTKNKALFEKKWDVQVLSSGDDLVFRSNQ